MIHTYNIQGMTCNGCRSHVEETLSNVPGVEKVTVDLDKNQATIEMSSHVPIETFQKVLNDDGARYSINPSGETNQQEDKLESTNSSSSGAFYCPMHCEGEKTYDQPGKCPVCGMNLVEKPQNEVSDNGQWTCSMHPDVRNNAPGKCPICGMNLVPL